MKCVPQYYGELFRGSLNGWSRWPYEPQCSMGVCRPRLSTGVAIHSAGMVVRHKCDVPYCVNPEHLELGSQWQNAMDCIRRGRTNFPKKRDVCVRGLHKMEGHNLIVWKSKKLATGEPYWGRQCRACKRAADYKKRKSKGIGVTDTDALRATESEK